MSPVSPSPLPVIRPPSLITRLVELREAADMLSRARHLDPHATLVETRLIVEAVFAEIPRIHDVAQGPLSQTLAKAESFALRELTAARRHQDLAARSAGTCRAACELSLRAITRGIDALLAELVPHSMVPAI